MTSNAPTHPRLSIGMVSMVWHMDTLGVSSKTLLHLVAGWAKYDAKADHVSFVLHNTKTGCPIQDHETRNESQLKSGTKMVCPEFMVGIVPYQHSSPGFWLWFKGNSLHPLPPRRSP